VIDTALVRRGQSRAELPGDVDPFVTNDPSNLFQQ